MSDLSTLATPAVEDLLQSDEDQLYEELGLRASAMATDPSAAGQFEPQVQYAVATMGTMEDLKRFGQRLFRRWNREAFDLMCGSDDDDVEDRQKLVEAIGIGEIAIAAALASLLVSSFGLAPAIAAVVAALIVKRFFRPAYEEFCQVWKESLPDPG